MNTIDEYQAAQHQLRKFNDWASLIGKEYFGGTRGRGGSYGQVVSAAIVLTIYHQEYDGARNYHDLEPDHARFMALVAKDMAGELINRTRKLMEAELEDKRIKALSLVDALKRPINDL